MKSLISILITGVISLITITSCSGVRDELGLNRTSPDEFAVVKRAPLEIPDSLQELPSPAPGAQRPQETAPIKQAKKVLTGNNSSKKTGTNISDGEQIILSNIGADSIDKNIRITVDQETARIKKSNRAVIDKFLKLDISEGTQGKVIDPKEEIERLERVYGGNNDS